MECVLFAVLLWYIVFVQAWPVRRGLGEQEQALGLEMARQSLHPTLQTDRQTDRQADRQIDRQTDR